MEEPDSSWSSVEPPLCSPVEADADDADEAVSAFSAKCFSDRRLSRLSGIGTAKSAAAETVDRTPSKVVSSGGAGDRKGDEVIGRCGHSYSCPSVGSAKSMRPNLVGKFSNEH